MSQPFPSLFQSPAQFRQAFVAGLRHMLDGAAARSNFGAYILVLANAIYDAEIFAAMSGALRERFELLAAEIRDALAQGRSIHAAPDDLLVFLKLMAVGFERLQPSESRHAGPWQLQYNQVRAFRPARMSDAVVSTASVPFSRDGFHFNKPFLRDEILWEGEINGLSLRLLYNKFPFAELHGLLVPEPEAEHPQLLTAELWVRLWRLADHLSETLPGLGLGFNGYGAFASVNHLHIQTYVRARGRYPVEDGRWVHNGGTEPYPLGCEAYGDAQSAWQRLHELHGSELSYNLLLRPGRLYLCARKRQGGFTHAPWTGGFAWSEVMGNSTTFNREDYLSLEAGQIAAELTLIAP